MINRFMRLLRRNRELWVLMLPILITQFAQAGYGLVDTFMASRYSAYDLAAVALGAGIWLPLFMFMLGVIVATAPILGKLIGELRHSEVALGAQQSLWLSLALGIGFAVVLSLSPLAFEIMHVPDNLRGETAQYLRFVAIGFPAIALYTSLRSYSESLSLALPVTVISVIGVLLNIPLNALFIYGWLGAPELGGAGAGVASAIVMWSTLLMLALYLATSHRYEKVRFYRSFARPSRLLIGQILSLGLPIGVAIFFEASLFSLAAVFLAKFGEVTLAAHQIALSITAQLFMIPLSMALALTILVSRCYGAKDWKKYRQLRRDALTISTLLALATMAVLIIWRAPLTALYTDNPAVALLASQLLLFAFAYQLVDAWQVVFAGILRGLHDTKTAMWMTLISYYAIGLTMGVWLAHVAGFEARGFWFGIVVALSVAAVLLGVRVRIMERRLMSPEG